MRNVNFIEVGMKNFGPYIDPMVLSFPNDSLTLVTGPNGIGKTMALDAIPYTLYGMTSKGAKADDVVNNVVGKNCKTWVKFSINNDTYEVIRYRKYSKMNNTVTISKNGTAPYKKGQTEVLPEVSKLLCPSKSFMNTLMFGQKVKDFFTDLVDSDKKEIFRMILNIDRYQNYYEETKKAHDEISEYVSNTKSEIQVKFGLLQDAEDQIKFLKKKKQEFIEEKESAIKDLKQRIESNQRMFDQWKEKSEKLKEKQEDWKEIEQRILQLEKEEESIEVRSNSVKEELIKQKETKLSELRSQADKAQHDYKIKRMESDKEKREYHTKIKDKIVEKIEKLIKEKNDFNMLISKCEDAIINAESIIQELEVGLQGSSCPTCLQKITEECKNILLSKIADKRVIVDENSMRIENELKPARTEILEKVQKLVKERELADQTLKIDLKDSELILLQQQQNSDQKLFDAEEKVENIFSQHLQKIKTDQQEKLKPIYEEREKILKVARKHKNLEEEIDEIDMTLTSMQRSIIQLQSDLKSKESLEFDDTQTHSYEKKVREFKIQIKNDKKQIEEAEIELEIFAFWKVGFSPRGIPSMLIDESIPFMNRSVSEYLDKLTNGRYVVSFDTLAETKSGEFRDKISVNVLDTHTRASSRIQLSGGQTRIIDIATILTLGDLQSNIQGVSFNILLFDEIFDSLDEENIGFVSKVLSNMKVGKSIYLISHRHEDQLEADEVLTLN
jgi:DNA repair exonuclease SbcCD ATPase subunit